METFFLIISCVTTAVFGGLVVLTSFIKDDDGNRRVIGLFLALAGFLMMLDWCSYSDYRWRIKEYDSDKYEIVTDTLIVNHNGQIDTTATFRIVEK